jgi:hypothetical protein
MSAIGEMVASGAAKNGTDLALPAITTFPDLAIYLGTPMAPARTANGVA